MKQAERPIEQAALPGMATDEGEGAVVEGTVRRVTFRSDETSYTVLRLEPDEGGGTVTAVGTLPPLHESEHLRLTGRWTRHRRFGRQFEVSGCTIHPPLSVVGLQRYLASGLVKGIGKGLAKQIVSHFGTETLAVLDGAVERLGEVPTIGPKRVEAIRKAWKGHRLVRDLMVFLQGVGVTPHLAARIYKEYGDEAMSVLRADPYRMVRDMRGVGFRTADRVALQVGLDPGAAKRLQAALLHTLDEASREGHVLLPEAELLERGREFIGGEGGGELAEALAVLVARRDVVLEDGQGERLVYLPVYHRAERAVAEGMAALMRGGGRLDPRKVEDFVGELEGQGTGLHEGQLSALRRLVEGRVLVITGGPGTGKTTLLRHVCRLVKAQGLRLALAAPTGRAAKRMEEAVGEGAKTLHRLLSFQPATFRFAHDREHPLPCDALVVDECSMVDLRLMQSLLEALPADAMLILVGDVDQLPSVGAGWVFHDLIASGVLPCARLTHVFRQAADSLIVRSAHAINAGRLPVMSQGEDGDFFFIRKNSPEAVVDTIVELCGRRLPRRFGLDPLGDVQVLCPMHRGPCGTETLNERLAEALNGRAEAHRVGPRSFAEGDKVMQTVNDYDKDVFNGDMGFVAAVDGAAGIVDVRFGERVVRYEEADVDQLQRAFAISVHKSQGSEYPAVVMPVTTQHYVMLARNLLYTAVTRARRIVCLVGTERALSLAVGNDEVRRRNGRLVEILRERVGRRQAEGR